MGPPPATPSEHASEGEGLTQRIARNTWASLGTMAGTAFLATLVLFLLLALLTQNFVIALVGGILGGIATAAGAGYRWGFLQRVDQSRRGAPLWVRLLLPVPLFFFLLLLLLVSLGTLIEAFVLLVLADVVVSLVVTGAVVKLIGLWDDVPARVRRTQGQSRLAFLIVIGVFTGVLGSVLGLMLLEEAAIALGLFLPSFLAGAVLAALLTKWGRDARDGLRSVPIWGRILGFVLLTLALTFYFSLLIGPFLPNATIGYALSMLLGLALTVPLSIWARTWRDLWGRFLAMGEGHRVGAVLPAFPIAAALIFLLIVVLTSNFEIAYTVSIPAGLLAFLLVGLAFGVTQDIPEVVKRQRLPRRVGVFLLSFLLLTLYAYFAVALFTQLVEVSLLAGMLFATVVLALAIRLLGLAEGLGQEFEGYGAKAEAAVLGLVFLGVLVLAFIVVALLSGDFRVAFLVSVLVAAGANFAIAHATNLIEGLREALDDLRWYGELLLFASVFVLAFAYGTVAIGSFLSNVPLALTGGALFAVLAVVLVGWDLRIGEVMVNTADDQRSARITLLLLVFLGGFLVGLYATAALFSLAGNDLFGLPFFFALLAGSGATLGFSRWRGWEGEVLGKVRTRRDRTKVTVVLAAWLGLGVLTGFFLQSVPLDASELGLGEEGEPVPLTITLAAGLVIWTWLPALLFKAVAVERTPLSATLSMAEKPRFLASLGWGALAGLLAMVLLLSTLDSPVYGILGAVGVGYLVALGVTLARRRRRGDESA